MPPFGRQPQLPTEPAQGPEQGRGSSGIVDRPDARQRKETGGEVNWSAIESARLFTSEKLDFGFKDGSGESSPGSFNYEPFSRERLFKQYQAFRTWNELVQAGKSDAIYPTASPLDLVGPVAVAGGRAVVAAAQGLVLWGTATTRGGYTYSQIQAILKSYGLPSTAKSGIHRAPRGVDPVRVWNSIAQGARPFAPAKGSYRPGNGVQLRSRDGTTIGFGRSVKGGRPEATRIEIHHGDKTIKIQFQD